VGEPGRRLVEECLPTLRRELSVDFVIVNGENAAHGHGISARIAESWLEGFGIDVITTGNHAFDVKDIATLFQKESRLLRPANYPPGTPGNGYVKLHTNSGQEILVINLLGRVHMGPCDDPFRVVDGILAKERADIVAFLKTLTDHEPFPQGQGRPVRSGRKRPPAPRGPGSHGGPQGGQHRAGAPETVTRPMEC